MSGDLEQSPAYELHQALSAAEIRLLSNQAKDTVLQAWEEMVDHNRLFLLEVCCAEDSVLTDQCQQIFGEGTAERIAHWNGGDIETAHRSVDSRKEAKGRMDIARVWPLQSHTTLEHEHS